MGAAPSVLLQRNIMVDSSSSTTSPTQVDPADPSNLTHWRDEFGVTIEQLIEAVKAVGGRPQAVREHFLNSGSSAGAS